MSVTIIESAPAMPVAPSPPPPHETVWARLRERNATDTSKLPTAIASGREVLELPPPGPRPRDRDGKLCPDAFPGVNKYLTVSRANGWTDRATYTRIWETSAGKRRCTATIVIGWARGAERVAGYWRTNGAGRYVFAWAQRRAHPAQDFGAAGLTAAGLAAVLALPAVPCAGCSRVLAAHRPVASEPETAE